MARMKYALHVHHDILVEQLSEPIWVRRECIDATKPKGERELRQRLLRELTNEEIASLPQPVKRAIEGHAQAWDDYRKFWSVLHVNEIMDLSLAPKRYWGSVMRLDAMLKTYAAELGAWHKQVCVPDCPWDGKTIFPNTQKTIFPKIKL